MIHGLIEYFQDFSKLLTTPTNLLINATTGFRSAVTKFRNPIPDQNHSADSLSYMSPRII